MQDGSCLEIHHAGGTGNRAIIMFYTVLIFMIPAQHIGSSCDIFEHEENVMDLFIKGG